MLEIGRLKSVHQRYIFKLNKENERAQQEISDLKRKREEDHKTIEYLKNENESLSLRLKLSECTANGDASRMKTRSHEECGKKDKNEFEVDKILDDKLIDKTKHYLVRWKGFNKEHDSWEPKRNLNCEKKLRTYEQSKRKK